MSHSLRLHCPTVRLPPVIGHRGAAARAPENTLAGFRVAKALGCAWVEFDARLTADGALVLCHDRRLDRTTDGSGPIAEQTLEQIRRCEVRHRFGAAFAGERVPTLDEALLLARELDLGANIEIKAERGREYASGAAVAMALQQMAGALPPLLVSSFEAAALEPMRRMARAIPRGILFRLVPRHWRAVAERLGCTIVGADHRRLSARGAAEIRAAGYQLSVFTVNDPARARLLFGWGITSVFSDVPDIILAASTGQDAARRPQGAFR